VSNGNAATWKQVGSQLRRQRIELGYSDRQSFVDAHGLKYRIINDLENGKRDNYEMDTLIAAEVAYRVVPGLLKPALDGGTLEFAAPGRDAAVQGPAASAPAGPDYLAALTGDAETDLAQSRAIVEAMIRVPRAEIVGHVGQVALDRGIVVNDASELDKLNALDGRDLYAGDEGLNPVLAAIWDIKSATVPDRFDLMAQAVLKYPAGNGRNLRSA